MYLKQEKLHFYIYHKMAYAEVLGVLTAWQASKANEQIPSRWEILQVFLPPTL